MRLDTRLGFEPSLSSILRRRLGDAGDAERGGLGERSRLSLLGEDEGERIVTMAFLRACIVQALNCAKEGKSGKAGWWY